MQINLKKLPLMSIATSMMALALISCGGGGGSSPATAEPTTPTPVTPTTPTTPVASTALTPAQLLSASPNPIHLALTADAATTARSATISSATGGTLTATGSDGTTYQLSVPAGALPQDTLITMTPVAGISNLPLSGGLGGAVKFEPEGLTFIKDAILTIGPSKAIPASSQITFGFSGSGEDMVIGSAMSGNDIRMVIRHFSGAGVGNGTSADKAVVLNRIANRVEARLESEVGNLMTETRGKDQMDIASSDRIKELFTEFENSVVKNRLTAAGAESSSCQDSKNAIDTLITYERQRSLIDLPQSSAWVRLESALENGFQKCRPAKVEECKKLEKPEVLLQYDLTYQRTRALLNLPPTDNPLANLAYYEQTCKGTGWTGITTGLGVDSGSGIQWQYSTNVQFVLDTEASKGNTQVFKIASGTLSANIPSGRAGTCILAGASGSTPLTVVDGELKIDLAANTYTGMGVVAAARIPLTVTVTCPGVPAISYNAAVPALWFWADDMPRLLAPDGKSFQAKRESVPSQGTTFSNEWTFTRK